MRAPARRPAGWRPDGYLFLLPALSVLVLFFLAAMAVLLSFSFERFVGGRFLPGTTTGNFTTFLGGHYYWSVIATTVKLGTVTTFLCALIGYPTAYALNAMRRPLVRNLGYFALFAPLLTSVIVRSYGWSLLLGDHGFINQILLSLHVVRTPVPMLYEFSGVVIALVHILLPFMVFPVVSVLGQLDPALKLASADLGANRLQTFFRVTLPLTVQGLVVGCELVFALSISAFATPSLLGGGRVQVLPALIYNEVGGLNWPLAAVESYALLVLALAVIGIFTLLLRGPVARSRGAT
ncbi:MAG TPA: ABC transporter permease [Candidatus Dormibacteraeota bacterium]|nr:ABC transporter permease [Candidatus Dormibacteraeota bacterium]